MKRNVQTALLLCTTLLFTLPALSQTKTFKGKVTDEEGIPIPGVSVSVNGTKSGTITKSDGSLKLVLQKNPLYRSASLDMVLQSLQWKEKSIWSSAWQRALLN